MFGNTIREGLFQAFDMIPKITARESVVAGVGDIVGQIVLLKFVREIALKEVIFSLRRTGTFEAGWTV